MRIKSLPILAVLGVASMLTTCSRHLPKTTQSPTLPNWMPSIRSLAVLGPLRALVVTEAAREIKLTQDGGQTWQVITPRKEIECATIVGTTVWAVDHRGNVLKKDLADVTWTTGARLKDFNAGHQIEFIGPNGWVRDSLSIWYSGDNGITWREILSVLTPNVHGQPTWLFPIDREALVISGTKGQTYLTKDAGATWKIETKDASTDFKDVVFVDRLTGYLMGYRSKPSVGAVLFTTKDGGEKWDEVQMHGVEIYPHSISFIGNEGWLAGSNYASGTTGARSSKALLFRTYDGGRSWGHVQIDSDEAFFSLVRFVDKQHGWVVGQRSLYRSEDGGNTWQAVLSFKPKQ